VSDSAKIRIPWPLAKRLDEVRGGVPRERYVRDVLEAHVENATAEPGGQAASSGEGRSSRSKPVGAGSTPARPASRPDKPFRPAPKGK
jgi:hypothetical protein